MIFSTEGFDVSVQLRQDFLRKVLAAAYFTGAIPDFTFGTTDVPLFGEVAYEIYLGAPTLNILAATETTPTIEYIGDFTARLSMLDHEINGRFSLPVPIVIMTLQRDGETAQSVRFDLRDITADEIQMTLNPPSQIFEAIARERIAETLRNTDLNAPLSPSVEGGPFMAFQTFADPSQDLFPIIQVHENNYLSVFVNLDGRVAAVPTTHPPQLWRANPVKQRNFDSATAIPEARFMPAMRQAVLDAGLIEGQLLPGTTDGMNVDVVVGTLQKIVLSKAVDLQLIQGALRVRFSVIAFIDGTPDVIANVDAKLGLSPANNKLFINLLNPDDFVEIDLDVPLLGQILLGLLSGGLIPLVEQILEEVLELAISTGIQSASAPPLPLPEQTVFLGSIAITTGAPPENTPALIVRNHELELFPEGIILRSWIDLIYTRVQRRLPAYFRAHKQSLQFHKEGCHYGDMISQKNLRVFIRPELALQAGFDGCKICLPEFDGNSPGILKLFFERLGLPAETEHHEKVSWTCTYISGNKTSGTNQTQSMVIDDTHKASTTGRYLSSATMTGLRPGNWHVAVSNGTWSTQSSLNVIGDQQNRYLFTMGIDKPKKA